MRRAALVRETLRDPGAAFGVAVFLALLAGTLFAPWVAPQNPFDPGQLSILDARLPPVWAADGDPRFPLGTDAQGRDMLSAVLYGARVSLLVAFGATLAAMMLGVTLGLIAGWFGGRLDALIMRLADVQLSFPTILVALLIDGVARNLMPKGAHQQLAVPILIGAIALSSWVQYARTVRGSTLVEKAKDYVAAAQLTGLGTARILATHLLPNVAGPVLVLATLGFGAAILTEATLSFLGLGVPATRPSLGTLIRIGNEVLFGGEWWVTIVPGVVLVLLVLAINLLGDRLRDVLNPKLR
jgi:peptide/nickel transport system permease protein